MGKNCTLLSVVFGVLLLTGCSQSLTTAETCLEIKAIEATYPSVEPDDPDELKAIQEKIVGQLTKLSKMSSETFKDGMQSAVKVMEGNVTGLDAGDEDYDAASIFWDQYDSVCLNKE